MDATTILRDRIAITLLHGIGAQTAKKLIAYAGSESAVLQLKRKSLTLVAGIGDEKAKLMHDSVSNALERADKEVEFIEKHQLKTCYYTDPDYPKLLFECDDCPLLLYMRGNIDLKGKKILSVVGTRKATGYGKQMIKEVIGELASRHNDLVVVSGLAYGIDITAHRTALEHQVQTIGLLGNGLSTLYPSEHRQTAIQMLENGGIMTEFISTAQPEPKNFLMRNRIIAGISQATWVVESAIKGGSLITANMANSYNRDVFACPGRINDPYSSGCNKLIKMNKANLLETASDLEYIMGWDNKGKNKTKRQATFALTEEERTLYQLLRQNDKIQMDELVRITGQNIHLLSALLLTLEFKGAVQTLPGNRYTAL